jgi:hypothetical protein
VKGSLHGVIYPNGLILVRYGNASSSPGWVGVLSIIVDGRSLLTNWTTEAALGLIHRLTQWVRRAAGA